MTIYGPDLELANRLRYWLNPIGVNVVEIDGWRVRGRTYATFNPYGSVNHHTAGSRLGVAPSLGICINGRAGLPGPLCHVHQQRNDVVNVVAAGVANHAGGGGWQGLKGNQAVFGLEVEHCGYADEPFPERRLDISCRVHAAFISGLSRTDAAMQCQHFEWSNEGKIDFVRSLLPGGAAGFRFRVAQLLASGPGGSSTPQPQRKLDMTPAHCLDDRGRHWSFIVGTDNDCWASVDNSGFFALVQRGADNQPRTQFVSGLSAMLFKDGRISVLGQGTDNHAWQITFWPDDTKTAQVGVVDDHPHSIKA